MTLFNKRVFRDTNGHAIRHGSRVYFCGDFPASMPVFNESYYKHYGVKHARDGFAYILDNKLCFVTVIDNQLRATGLCWDFDGKRCFDLTLVEY